MLLLSPYCHLHLLICISSPLLSFVVSNNSHFFPYCLPLLLGHLFYFCFKPSPIFPLPLFSRAVFSFSFNSLPLIYIDVKLSNPFLLTSPLPFAFLFLPSFLSYPFLFSVFPSSPLSFPAVTFPFLSFLALSNHSLCFPSISCFFLFSPFFFLPFLYCLVLLFHFPSFNVKLSFPPLFLPTFLNHPVLSFLCFFLYSSFHSFPVLSCSICPFNLPSCL